MPVGALRVPLHGTAPPHDGRTGSAFRTGEFS